MLINNAAIVIGKKLLDMDIAEIEKSLVTNLVSHFYTLKAFIPAMLRSGLGGTVVTVSSVLGEVGAAQLTDYSAAKAGLIALHKSLTAELRADHPEMRTILVTPGQLSTPLFYGVQTPNMFLAPVVEPVDVARRSSAPSTAAGPSTSPCRSTPGGWRWYNVLPVGLQQLVRRLAGVDTAMKTFIGRRGNELSEKNGTLIQGF